MSNFLIDNLKTLREENLVSFHVPGHKNGRIVKDYYKKYFNDILEIDTTEIPGTDNLHQPEGGIKNSQERIAKLYGTKKSYILVNGTSCGILSMIMASTKPGDKILMAKNCHKSVYNAILLGKLSPVFIEEKIDENTGILLDISPDLIEAKLREHSDIRAVILTYPNYNGICSDISQICDLTRKYDKLLLVDEAHGAHLPLSSDLPKSSLEAGADIVVQSTHKSLPSFTQSSVIHVNSDRVDLPRLEMMLSAFQSSSPSYLLMSSVDIAMEIFEKEGKNLMKNLLEDIRWFKGELHKNTKFKLVDREFLGFKSVFDFDITKINIITTEEGYTGHETEKILREKFSIQIEFSTDRNLLLVTSIGNMRSDFEKLLDALIQISGLKNPLIFEKISKEDFILERGISINEAFYAKGESIALSSSEGFISLDFVIPYPPGIPIVTPGEILSKNLIKYLFAKLDKGYFIMGISGEKEKSIRIFKG